MKSIAGAFFLIFLCLTNVSARAADPKKSAYDRILRTQTIRCGYLIYSPYFTRDLRTGAMAGIFHDLTEAIAKNAGLKVEWTEEVGYDNIFAGLDTGRYDVFCGGLWPSTERTKSGWFSTPAFYSIVAAWARADEKRFAGLQGINDPAVRIATVDGALEGIIARTDFPRAQTVSLPQLTPFSMNFENIVNRKADIIFAEPSVVDLYLQHNPGKLKEIAPDKPLRIFGNSLVVRRGETDLKFLLDAGMQELVFSGAADKILRRYEDKPGLFLRVAKPYEAQP